MIMLKTTTTTTMLGCGGGDRGLGKGGLGKKKVVFKKSQIIILSILSSWNARIRKRVTYLVLVNAAESLKRAVRFGFIASVTKRRVRSFLFSPLPPFVFLFHFSSSTLTIQNLVPAGNPNGLGSAAPELLMPLLLPLSPPPLPAIPTLETWNPSTKTILPITKSGHFRAAADGDATAAEPPLSPAPMLISMASVSKKRLGQPSLKARYVWRPFFIPMGMNNATSETLKLL